MESNITTLTIPKPLAEKIRERIKGTSFNTISDYVAYIMEQVLARVEGENSPRHDKILTQKDEEEVKAQLKSLGYLD